MDQYPKTMFYRDGEERRINSRSSIRIPRADWNRRTQLTNSCSEFNNNYLKIRNFNNLSGFVLRRLIADLSDL
jgi:hypothetical protein